MVKLRSCGAECNPLVKACMSICDLVVLSATLSQDCACRSHETGGAGAGAAGAGAGPGAAGAGCWCWLCWRWSCSCCWCCCWRGAGDAAAIGAAAGVVRRSTE